MQNGPNALNVSYLTDFHDSEQHMTTPRILLPFVLTLFLVAAGCGGASDPNELVDLMVAQAQDDYNGINDFTVRTGTAHLYYRRVEGDTLANFDLRAFAGDSLNRRPIFDPYHLPNAASLANGLRNNSTYGGNGTIGGHPVVLLNVVDVQQFVGAATGDSTGMGPQAVTVSLDESTYRVREIQLTAALEDGSEPLIQRHRYTDFRDVRGLTIPFSTATITEGIEVPEEVRIVEAPSLAMARVQAEQLAPGPQRDAELRSVEQRERYLTQGILEEGFVVDSVLVNLGVPREVFEPLNVENQISG